MPCAGLHADAFQLQTVRLRGAEDALRARQRLERALAGLGAAGETEVLIVRSIRPAQSLPTSPLASAACFVAAVRADLEAKADRARRPWREADAVGADAVIFADEGELAACLLRDCLHGSLNKGWWWRGVLCGASPADWVQRNVLARGDLLPAVVAILATRGLAHAWIARLHDSAVRTAVAAVIAAHGLTHLDRTHESAAVAHAAEEMSRPQRALLPHRRDRLLHVVPEVWQLPAVSPAGRSLLVLALVLQRASAWVITSDFAAVWGRCGSDEEDFGKVWPSPDGDADAASSKTCAASADTRAESPSVGGPVRLHEPEPPAHIRSSAGGVADQGAGTAAQPLTETGETHFEAISLGPSCLALEASPTPCGAQRTGDGATGSFATDASFASDGVTSVARVIAQPSTAYSPPLPMPGSATGVTARDAAAEKSPGLTGTRPTGYGGLFYLLNVAMALGLYGDFTQPRAPGIALSPWDWLALIGLAWFGEAFRGDPVWTLLAKLAGRATDEHPGEFFLPPDEWRMPDPWLMPWGNIHRLTVFASRRRLELWHPAGFVILETKRSAGAAPLAQARTLCAGDCMLRAARLQRGRRQPAGVSPPPGERRVLRRWLGWLLPYITARLTRALACDATADVGALVCRHPAALTYSGTRLDVHLSLDTLPVEIRLAGLDRDPGWIPAAGRSIAFHFT